MLDFPLVLQVKLPVVDRIQPQNTKFATGMENEATGDSELNNSPAFYIGQVRLVVSFIPLQSIP